MGIAKHHVCHLELYGYECWECGTRNLDFPKRPELSPLEEAFEDNIFKSSMEQSDESVDAGREEVIVTEEPFRICRRDLDEIVTRSEEKGSSVSIQTGIAIFRRQKKVVNYWINPHGEICSRIRRWYLQSDDKDCIKEAVDESQSEKKKENGWKPLCWKEDLDKIVSGEGKRDIKMWNRLGETTLQNVVNRMNVETERDDRQSQGTKFLLNILANRGVTVEDNDGLSGWWWQQKLIDAIHMNQVALLGPYDRKKLEKMQNKTYDGSDEYPIEKSRLLLKYVYRYHKSVENGVAFKYAERPVLDDEASRTNAIHYILERQESTRVQWLEKIGKNLISEEVLSLWKLTRRAPAPYDFGSAWWKWTRQGYKTDFILFCKSVFPDRERLRKFTEMSDADMMKTLKKIAKAELPKRCPPLRRKSTRRRLLESSRTFSRLH